MKRASILPCSRARSKRALGRASEESKRALGRASEEGRASTIALAMVVVGASLSGACMDTQTASLGVGARRVSDASASGERDAGRDVAEDELSPDDGASVGDDEAEVPGSDVDSGAGATDAGRAPAQLDAGRAPAAAADAGPVDGSISYPDDHDAAHQDAKVPVNPLCIAEPWHCP